VSTGLHGIQISSDGDDESSCAIDVSAYLMLFLPCLIFQAQTFPAYTKLIKANCCTGGSEGMGFELAQ
jgi:hypothetical protein